MNQKAQGRSLLIIPAILIVIGVIALLLDHFYKSITLETGTVVLLLGIAFLVAGVVVLVFILTLESGSE